MTQSEFTEMTNILVTDEQFATIHEMYMLAGDMDKETFCNCYKDVQNNSLYHEYYRQLRSVTRKLETAKNLLDKTAEVMIKEAQAFGSTECKKQAVKIMGEKNYIKYLLKNDMPLWDMDKEIITSLLDY